MSETQGNGKLAKARAHKAKMLRSIITRLEQCQATAFHYGITRAETALAACLKELLAIEAEEGGAA